METTMLIIVLILLIFLSFITYLIGHKLNIQKTKSENLTNDNRLKAESIERHLKEKMEMQQEYNVHLTNLRKRVADLELEVSKSNREYRAQENTIEVIAKDCDDLREIITRKDETIARYVAEINGNKKKPYVFDESKAPKTKSKTKQQVAAAKRLRDENGKFVN